MAGVGLDWLIVGFVRVVRVATPVPGPRPSWHDHSLTERHVSHVHLDDKPARGTLSYANILIEEGILTKTCPASLPIVVD